MPQNPLTIVKEEPLTVVSEEPAPAAADDSQAGVLGRGLAGFWEQINPVTMVQGLAGAVADPVGTVKGIGKAQGEEYAKAARAFEQGDYVTGARHGLAYLVPLLGPALSAQADKGMEGDIAGMVGGSTGLGLATFGPSKLPGMSAKTPALFKPTNAVDVAADAFAQQRGLPRDAATASGSKFVRGAQQLMDRSTLGGAIVAERAQGQTAKGLARVGEELASDVHPTAVAPEQAGQAFKTAVEGKIQAFDKVSDVEYGKFRSVENAAPKQSVQVGTKTEALPDGTTKTVPIMEDIAIPVNIKTVRAMLKPIYDQMRRQMPVTVLRASRGWKSIENIMGGNDFLPASVAELDLSAIKDLARGADMPELRSMSQGLAAGAVKQLQKSIDGAVQQFGGQVASDALKAGRAATKSKVHLAKDFPHLMMREPVSVFQQATWRADAGIENLRKMARTAPAEMSKIGRAYLDDLLSKATRKGGFDKGQTLASRWNDLGPKTKQLLYGPKAAELDKFFHYAERVSENVNPSGSGFIAAMGANGAYTIMNPITGLATQIAGAGLAKLLRTDAGIRALTQGFQIKFGDKARAAATVGQLAKLAGKDAVTVLEPMAVPLTVEDSQPLSQP